MPETNRVHEREEASSKTEEPGIGAKKAAKFLAELSAPQAEAAAPQPETVSQTPQASDEAPPEDREEKSINKFAESVASSLKLAGIEIDGREAPRERSEKAGQRKETGFLGDWEGFDGIHELSADLEISEEQTSELQPFAGAGHSRTLSEIALASEADRESDLSLKHDELADAVQAALISVYGEAPPELPAREREAPAYSPELHASGPGWASEDTLSPQDVILNYFDYQPAARTGRNDVPHHVNGDAGYDAASTFSETLDYLASQHQPQSPRSLDAYAEYDAPPSYPVPAGYTAPEKRAGAAERESGRLLGAAAIGLVGGIAIAASLAVFVIGSYGPGGRTATGAASQPSDASEPGYGRWLERTPDGETPATSAPEVVPVVAASDVAVTPGQPSGLAIEVKPEQANERSLISLTGIPEGARLNAGVDAGGGNWLLPPRRLAGLTINVPAGTSDATLGVQVLDGNVRTPLSEKRQFAIHVNGPKPEPAINQPKPEPTTVMTFSQGAQQEPAPAARDAEAAESRAVVLQHADGVCLCNRDRASAGASGKTGGPERRGPSNRPFPASRPAKPIIRPAEKCVKDRGRGFDPGWQQAHEGRRHPRSTPALSESYCARRPGSGAGDGPLLRSDLLCTHRQKERGARCGPGVRLVSQGDGWRRRADGEA